VRIGRKEQSIMVSKVCSLVRKAHAKLELRTVGDKEIKAIKKEDDYFASGQREKFL
jgi:hypothetical protein